MQLFDLIRNKKVLAEGGNLSLPGGHEAQQIDLKVHNRGYIVPILDNLINSINNAYSQQFQAPLWDPKLLKQKTFLSGSSLHFFNTDIPDEEFIAKKPKVGDIDTQVNKDNEANLEQFLTANQNKIIGPAKLLGFQRGNEQFSSLWEFTDPPIKIQIDLEFVKYDKKGPTAWSQFSHSSSWDDLQAGIKGVFHKFLIQSFTSLTNQDFLLRKMVGRGKAKEQQDIPTTDNMFSFAVSSSEGGGLRAKYAPVLDEKGQPLVINGLPVMQALPPAGYEQDLSKIFATIFDTRVNSAQLKKLMPKTWSFTGLIDVMNLVLDPEEKAQVVDGFISKLFAKGAQGLYKNDPDRDLAEKNAALNYMLKALGTPAPTDLEQLRQTYRAGYKMTTEGPVGLDRPNQLNEAEVKAQFRKNMPHLRDLKPIDFLDLLDEISDGNGNFKLQNIPLNVKVDGFGGRFGKDAEGKPFMATSNTPPRYKAGFVQYHQEKGTTDPEILGRAEKFDQLFNEMMNAIQLVDSKLGPDFLINKQVTCEVLFLPFATETDEGKLKFVGIQYDKFPAGVQLVLVPFRVVDASTGEDIPDADKVIESLTQLGGQGSVKFISNSLMQKDGLDVTEIINPLDNIEALKQIVSDTQGKRDRASLQLRREVEEKLLPVKIALEKAIDTDPNIIGKDILGQDYEGIVINSRLGPIKVTSQQQKDIITAKNAAKAAARTEQPRTGNKTAVVAVGSFVGHKGHQELFKYTIDKAKEVNGDPYLFMGNAVGKDDPIPVADKIKTWRQLYPSYAKNISAVTQEGGSLMQKIKHELINPLPGKPPRYDNVIIMVGEDQAGMNIANALMKAVNKFQGYEHVKVSLEPTPRGTGMSFTKLRNILKTGDEQAALNMWNDAFNGGDSGAQQLPPDWIKHLMDISKTGMGIQQQPATALLPAQQPVQQPAPVAERLSNALIRPRKPIAELSSEKLGQYKAAAGAQASAADKAGDTKKADKRFSGIVKATKKQFANDEKGVAEGSLEEMNRRGFLKGLVGAGTALAAGGATAKGAKVIAPHYDKREKEREKARPEQPGNYQQIPKPKPRDSYNSIPKEGVAEGRPIGVSSGPAKPEALAKRAAWQKTPLTSNKIVIDGYTINFTPDALIISKGGKVLWKKEGDYSQPTNSTLAGAKKLVTGLSRQGQPDEKQMFGKVNPDELKSRKEHRKKWQQASNLSHEKKISFQQAWSQLFGGDEVSERMLPKSAFAGSDKHKLGPAAHAKGKQKGPVKKGQFVGGMEEAKKKGADGKACWKGYRYNGTENGKDKCVPVSEDVENIMGALIENLLRK